ncbi:aldo/keto reductase [Candidatus Bathyarchaeota archaeon]|nr:aldo/keto reductase [Candidatus Bathyarchaeota archaeon]
MEKRKLGRTGHWISVMAFGGAALSKVSQSVADGAVRLAMDHGVNHFDIAPSYGNAELRLRPWMKDYRSHIFLACKTLKRTKEEAWKELRSSMERLGVDNLDLHQFHALDKLEELDKVLGLGGAMEAFLEAREKGLIRFIGIMGHKPPILLEALRCFDFDTVLFPLNFVQKAHRVYEND